MTDTTHTPGPWFAEYGPAHNVIFADQGIACIATIHHGVEPSSDANARLIAAAPDMLEVMKRAVRLSREYPDFKLYAMDPFLDAIAKAKGK